MHFFEIGALLCVGYISGLSIMSGFALSAVHQVFVKGKSRLREVLWTVVACINMFAGGMAPIFAIAYLVVGMAPDRPDFYPRISLLTLGIFAGGAFAFAVTHLGNKAVRLLQSQPNINSGERNVVR